MRTRFMIRMIVASALAVGILTAPTITTPAAADRGGGYNVEDDGQNVVTDVASQIGMLETGAAEAGGGEPPRCDWRDTSGEEPRDREDGYLRWRLSAVDQERWDELGSFSLEEGPVYRYECWHRDMGCDEPKWEGDDGCYGDFLIGTDTFCGSPLCQFTALTPDNLAVYLVTDRLLEPLDDPEPQFSPPNQETLVNFDTWLWVDNVPADGEQGPWTITIPGPVSVTAWADMHEVRWDMGDDSDPESEFTCPITVTEADAKDNCSYRYKRSSAGQPDDEFQGNVAVVWQVTWEATLLGATFESDEPIEAYRDNEFSLAVAESQAIITED